MPNRLTDETSPYLLQHAENPVDWWPWGETALNFARRENRPILLSIGYSACHWCHVMAHESFEDADVAAVMNRLFVCIKVDREERPDLDQIYQTAQQMLTHRTGGWPLTMFLTPDGAPFFGGTYFPKSPRYGLPGFPDLLRQMAQVFVERRSDIDKQNTALLKAMSEMLPHAAAPGDLDARPLDALRKSLDASFDPVNGGFGDAPKFPHPGDLAFLMRRATQYGDAEAGKMALTTLRRMAEGGIHDQLGGGFSRYSVDEEWSIPHFEKMLYDNALLVSVLSEAFQLTKKERYKEVIEETMEFIQRELLLEKQSGFYTALDADSEGVEGKFYVWGLEEVKQMLGEDAELYCAYYDISENGNWEHSNILRVKKPIDEFAVEKNIGVDELKKILINCNKKLLQERSKRIRPLLDDKIILGWNALMNTACSKAYCATGRDEYRQLAINNMNFMLSNLKGKDDNAYHHTFKEGKAKFPAFLDDYAFLIEALIFLQEITADKQWIEKAKLLTNHVIQNFIEEETGFFFYTPVDQQDIIVRKKEEYDSAVPSGNSVMAYNLWKLSLLFDKKEWGEQSLQMASSLSNAISKYPVSFGNWASLLLEITEGTQEIAVVGAETSVVLKELLSEYIPHRIVMATGKEESNYPLLADKQVLAKTSIFLCRNYTCLKPVFSVNELMLLINKAQKQ